MSHNPTKSELLRNGDVIKTTLGLGLGLGLGLDI